MTYRKISSDIHCELLFFKANGTSEKRTLFEGELLSMLKEFKFSSRDLKLIWKCCSMDRVLHPTLLPRPNSKCIIFLLEHIKMICFTDQCIVLTPGNRVTRKFIEGLQRHFVGSFDDTDGNRDSLKMLQEINLSEEDFEYVVMEKAMEHVVEKFKKHLHIIKPALNLLLQQVEENAETNGLKKLLAVKKSMGHFQQNVENVRKVVDNMLEDEHNLKKMVLRDKVKGDMELILDSFSADIDEINTEIKMLIDAVEDTDQFVSAHLDSSRNELMKMSLFIEISALIMGFGAVVGGIFGMNLKSHIEEDANAFFIVCATMIIMMLLMLAGFAKKYYQLKKDTSSAQSFTLLKNFFTYVDDLEYHVFNKSITRKEFKEAIEKVTRLKISEKESDYLFQMVDANNDGVIDAENELNLDLNQHTVQNGTVV